MTVISGCSGRRLLTTQAVLLALLLAAGCSGARHDGERMTEAQRDEQRMNADAGRRPTSMPTSARPAGDDAQRVATLSNPAAIVVDVLIVDGDSLTVDEFLYPLRQEILERRRTQTARGFAEWLGEELRTQLRREVGSLLLFREAMSPLGDEQKKAVDQFVDKRIDELVNARFGGVSARLDSDLARFGLKREQLRSSMKRGLIVGQYTRDKFLPQVRIRRDELLASYEQSVARLSTAGSRELWIIEAPYARFVADGASWNRADAAARDAARSAAAEHIRAAHAALTTQPFDAVAGAFSRGVHAAAGGLWGDIALPLMPPYDRATQRLFEMREGDVSEPIETDAGWCIVRCGRITAAQRPAFADVQARLRTDLETRRLNELIGEYVARKAERAAISPLDPFIATAVRRVLQWPTDGGAAGPPTP